MTNSRLFLRHFKAGLSLAFIFCGLLAFGQYPAAPNKIGLGRQTTGDGLVFRTSGKPAYTPTTAFNAWMALDTTTGNLWTFRDSEWFLEVAGDLRIVYPLVINKSGVNIKQGQSVMIDTVQLVQGDQVRVRPAIATVSNSQFIMGVASTDINNDSTGYISWFGYVREVDHADIAQTGVTLDVGDILYISATQAGRYTDTEPAAPNVNATIALVVRKPNANNMTLLVRPWLNEKLGDLRDVDLAGLQTGDGIKWNGTKWVAGTFAGADSTVVSAGYGIDVSEVSNDFTVSADTNELATPYDVSLKQDKLTGTGLVKSTSGTISYITDNSTNWDAAYNDRIISAAFSGSGTKTLTLTQQDAGTVTASFTDLQGVTSVTAGNGLSGGTITTTGTISADTSVLSTKWFAADTASGVRDWVVAQNYLIHDISVINRLLFSNDNVSDTIASASKIYYSNYPERLGVFQSSPQATLDILGDVRIADLFTHTPTRIVGADADGDLGDLIIGNGLTISGDSLIASAGSGTVTSIATNNGITGGTITSSGTIGLTGQALALHNLSTNGVIARTGTGTVAGRTITAGTGISVTNGDGVSGNPTVTNSAPDQTVVLTAGTGINTSGTYPNFTITNSAPDQTVSITGAGINSVTGTYPNFTVTATEVDGSISNEGVLGVGAGAANTSIITSNTSGATGVTINGGVGTLITETTSSNGGTINILADTSGMLVSKLFLSNQGYTSNVGTVTSIATNNGITGGTITTTGTIGLTGQALALHNLSTNGLIARTGAGTVAGRTITAGTGISVTNGDGVSGNPTITNSAPDQTVVLTGGTGISTSGTYPNFTITNSAPDQTVSITGAGINSVTGTYPNFTITATEVDGSTTNEGTLGVGAGGANTAVINSNTSGATGVTIAGGTNVTITESTSSNGGTITVNASGGDSGWFQFFNQYATPTESKPMKFSGSDSLYIFANSFSDTNYLAMSTAYLSDSIDVSTKRYDLLLDIDMSLVSSVARLADSTAALRAAFPTTIYSGNGTLSAARTISTNGNKLTISGSNTAQVLEINNTNTGTTTNALTLQSFGPPLQATRLTSSTGSILPVSDYFVNTSSTAAVGLGGFQRFYIEDAGGLNKEAGRIGFRTSDATGSSYDSEAFISVRKDSSELKEGLTLLSTGQLHLKEYGDTLFTGTAVKYLAVADDGKVIEVDGAAGTVKGTGAANKVAIWASADSLYQNTNLHWDEANERLRLGDLVNPVFTPTLMVGTDVNFPGGLEFHTISSGTSADARVMVVDSIRHVFAFAVPGHNNNLQLFGLPRKDNVYIFNSGGITRDMTIGTLGNNDLHFGTNNNVRVKIDSIGRMGIGTTTPANTLDVEGGAAIGATYSGTNTAPTNGLLVEGNVGIGTTTPANRLDVEGGAAIGATYSGTSTAPTNGLIVEGRVGIGSTLGGSTTNRFNVNGNAFIGSALVNAAQNGLTVQGKTSIGGGDTTSVLNVYGSISRGLLRGVATPTYTVALIDSWIRVDYPGTCELTLPNPTTFAGREIMISTITANTVISNASNVVPITGGAAGTAILPATDGAWCTLVSDGNNWVIMQRGS